MKVSGVEAARGAKGVHIWNPQFLSLAICKTGGAEHLQHAAYVHGRKTKRIANMLLIRWNGELSIGNCADGAKPCMNLTYQMSNRLDGIPLLKS